MTDYSRFDGTIYTRDRLRGLTALIAGAGALGNEVIKVLGSLGVGALTVVDPDTVESSNLTRSIFFRTGHYQGKNKAEAITNAAAPIFPDTRFRALPVEISDVGLGEFARVSMVFSCVDSDLARLEIAYLCAKLNVLWCDAGLGANNYSHGRVTWFPGRSSACFSCMLPARRRRELLTAWEPIVTRCGDTKESLGLPSTPTMAAVVGSLQVDFALKNYLAEVMRARTVEIDLTCVPRLECFSVEQSTHCPFHWSQVQEDQVHPMPSRQTRIGEWLAELNARTSTQAFLYLDWPICVRARCLGCHSCWMPLVRAAVVRRAVCPNCGSNEILALEYIRGVDPDSEWADYSFGDFHLPDDHLITARFIHQHR